MSSVARVPDSGASRIDALTGVRALAALWVVAFHAWLIAGKPVLGAAGGPLRQLAGGVATSLASMGWLGVDLFFVLSGFVLTWQALGDPASPFVRGRFWRDAATFMRRRVLRVHPAYLATLTLLLPLGLYGFAPPPAGLGDVALHVVMFHNLVPSYVDTINGVYWSMPFEFQFYLLFPLLVVPVIRGRAWLLLAAALAVAAAMHVAAVVGGTGALPAQLPWRIDEFAAGMFAASVARRGGVDERLRGVIALAAFASLVAGAIVIAHVDTAWWQPGALPFVRMLWIDASAATLFYGLAGGAGPVVRLFAARPVVWLGAISYSIYLWHLPVLQLLRPRVLALAGALPRPTDFGLSLALVIAVATLSFYLVEQPFHSPSRDAGGLWRDARIRFRVVLAWGLAVVVFAAFAFVPARG